MPTTIVVPTNRPDRVSNFLKAWRNSGQWNETTNVIVVEDGPERSPGIEAETHVCWTDIRDDLGDDRWIISRKDSGIRCYGYYLAYKAGADVIVTLDDDCMPEPGQNLVGGHLANLTKTTRWCGSMPGVRTRGIPWIEQGILSTVKISHGLWCGVPDLDAVQSLNSRGTPLLTDFRPQCPIHVIPHGQYFPMCGMNLAFWRDATPLMYFPIMGEGWPYRRFDDIWCGLIAKKVCDHLGWHIVSGEPYVRHERASGIMANLVKEAPGISTNEWFWKVLDCLSLTENTAVGCVEELGLQLSEHSTEPYFQKLGQAMTIWAGLCRS